MPPDLTRDEVDATIHALLAMVNSACLRRSDEPLSSAVAAHLREMAHRMVFDASKRR